MGFVSVSVLPGWSEGVALLEQLGGDADSDFLRVVAAERQAEGAMEAGDEVGGITLCGEFGAEFRSFDFATDAAEKAEGSLLQGAGEDGEVGGVALGDGDDEGAGGQEVDLIFERLGPDRAEVSGVRQTIQPFGSGINAEKGRRKRQQNRDENLRNVARSEDCHGPRAGVAGFEEESDGATAGHSNIVLQVPFDFADQGLARGIICEYLPRISDGGGLDLATANGANGKTVGQDDHFRSDILRSAPADFDELDESVRLAFFFEPGQFDPEGGSGIRGCQWHKARG